MIQDKIDSITKNIGYLSESVSYLSVRDLDIIKESGMQDKNILKDLVSLRHYLFLCNQYKLYLESEGVEPDWSIKPIIEQSYGLIQHWLGLSYQWSYNDN